MKARNKITGKEITILGISKEYGTVSYIADGVLYHDNFASGALEIIDDSNPVDWSSFRREAAKDILAGMVANKVYRAHPDDDDEDYLKGQQRAAKRAAFTAVVYADELIKQLKEEHV